MTQGQCEPRASALITLSVERRSAYQSSAKGPHMHRHSRKSYLLNPQLIRISFNDSATAVVGMALLLLSCQLTAGCHSQPVVLPRIGSNSVDAGAVAERLHTLTSAEPPLRAIRRTSSMIDRMLRKCIRPSNIHPRGCAKDKRRHRPSPSFRHSRTANKKGSFRKTTMHRAGLRDWLHSKPRRETQIPWHNLTPL